jgi:hypothetical protein
MMCELRRGIVLWNIHRFGSKMRASNLNLTSKSSPGQRLESYGDFYHLPFRGNGLLYKGIYDVIIMLVGSTLLNFFFESYAD